MKVSQVHNNKCNESNMPISYLSYTRVVAIKSSKLSSAKTYTYDMKSSILYNRHDLIMNIVNF